MHYTQRTLIFTGGERFPILVNSENGLPHFYSTVFLAQTCRGKAANTVRVIAHAIVHLYCWSSWREIDIHARFAVGSFLTIPEIESLVAAFRMRTSALRKLSRGVSGAKRLNQFPKSSLLQSVRNQTVAVRLRYMESYLSYLAESYLHKRLVEGKEISDVKLAFDLMKRGILARVPPVGARAQVHQRLGLTCEQENVLLRMVDPDARENPWTHSFVRQRNFVMVLLLLQLGIRIGEALSIKIRDFDFQINRLKVLRRPDDIEDARKKEPNAKTFDRILAMDDGLASVVHKFILLRGRHGPSKSNDFLFTSFRTGKPLSYSSVFSVFKSLRLNGKGILPPNLCAHLLRHTWNDRFSEYAKRAGISNVEEEKIRSYLCGWKEGSGTASLYTKRHHKDLADRISLKLQEALRDAT